jgi:preprotein translocase subunit SecD
VKLIEQTSVGPSLGQEAILRGALSLAVGFFLVVAFMAGYYRRSGLIADLCVLSNIVLVLSALALFGATLTLPGIAGIVLTVGMAVDANVLIVERIREELRGGLPLAKSIEEGFRRAFLTIIDTHVTTLVSAVILYFMGTGPIKGFAVTLFIGMAASLFTAVFMAKLIMDSLLARKKDAWLSF